jgi:hypothetical protein
VAALFVIFRSSGGNGGGASDRVDLAFFSADDGKTWFPDNARKVPPFNRDGKDVYRAYIYKCPDGKEFVAFLERYTPKAKKEREALYAGGEQSAVPILDEAKGIEVKTPGQTTWVKQSDPRAVMVMIPRCAGGGKPQMVLP